MQRSNSSFYVVSLIVIVVLASFYYSWKSLMPEYQKNKNDLKKLEQEIISANAKLESLRVAKRDIDELGPVLDKIFVAVPKDADEPNILSEIEAIAKINKLALPSMQIGGGSVSTGTAVASDQSASPPGSTVSISFNVVGEFEGISKLTKALENDLKFMNIKNLTLASGKEGISASYQIEAYKTQSSSLILGQTAGSNLTTEGGL